jgi:hypothetical protein
VFSVDGYGTLSQRSDLLQSPKTHNAAFSSVKQHVTRTAIFLKTSYLLHLSKYTPQRPRRKTRTVRVLSRAPPGYQDVLRYEYTYPKPLGIPDSLSPRWLVFAFGKIWKQSDHDLKCWSTSRMRVVITCMSLVRGVTVPHVSFSSIYRRRKSAI